MPAGKDWTRGSPQGRAPPLGLGAPSPTLGKTLGPLTFSLCRALFSSPSTCSSFLATPTQGRSVRMPRWQATPKPTGADEGEAGAVGW